MTLSADSIARDLGTTIVGRQVTHKPVVASTMDEARRMAATGAPEGTVVVADAQTAGRGRFRRRWVTPPRVSIAVSIVFRPSAGHTSVLSQMGALAAAQAIEAVTELDIALKWPNDLMINGRKVGGVLVESDDVGIAILGIGINVNLDPASHAETAAATSLALELGMEVSRLALLRRLLQELDRLYLEVRGGGDLRTAWVDRLETLGQMIRVQTPSGIEEGLAAAVDSDGALLLRRRDGSQVRLFAGDVTTQIPTLSGLG